MTKTEDCKQAITTAKRILPLMIIAVLSVSLVSIAVATEEETTPDVTGCTGCHPTIEGTVANFETSLHHAIAGIYGEFGRGAGEQFNLSIPEGCTKCHIQSCDSCHKDFASYPGSPEHGKKVEMDTCVECHHSRAGVNYVGYLGSHEKKGPSADIHHQLGLNCTDCHTPSEIHGDGEVYSSEKEAVKVRCEDCHNSPGKVINGMEVTQFSTETPAHKIHEGKLDCSACHAGWMQTCYNCHLETKKVDKSYVDKFHLGVGYEGEIRPFYHQRVSKGNESYDRWVEWTPHTITKEAHNCSFCHENPELLGEGRTGIILGPKGASFIPQETIDKVLAVQMPAGAPAATPTETPAAATPTPPGFELILAVIAIAVLALLVMRKR